MLNTLCFCSLIKDCNKRPKYKDLLQHPFVAWAREQPAADYLPFVESIIE